MGKGLNPQGNASLLKTVLERPINMAREKTAVSNPDLPDAESVARQVGVGAVVFNDLKNRRTRDVKFDQEAILNPQGETGPYMQYTQARCASVMDAAPQAVTTSRLMSCCSCPKNAPWYASSRISSGLLLKRLEHGSRRSWRNTCSTWLRNSMAIGRAATRMPACEF